MQAHMTKQNRYRAKLREQGLRPIQIWVPDTRRPGFAEECRRQSQLVSNDPREQEHLDFAVQAAATIEGWE
ncbi:MAG: antitoxin MazE family protein [Acidobacteriota bacterium]